MGNVFKAYGTLKTVRSDVLIRDRRVPKMLPAFICILYIRVGQSDGGDLHMVIYVDK